MTILAVIVFATYAMPGSMPARTIPQPAPIPPPDRITETYPGELPGITDATPPLEPFSTVEMALLEQQRQLLRKGVIGFRGPEPMRVDEPKRVTVRVADKASAASVTALPGTGSVTVDPAIVGSYLKAALTSPDFDIKRVGDDDGRRVLITNGYAEWAWDVRPLRSGQHQLDVTLYVLLNGDNMPLTVRTYERAIQVEVNTWYSVTNWFKEWAPLTGLTLPVIIGGVWAFIQHNRSIKHPASGLPTRVSRPSSQPRKLRRHGQARRR